MALAAELDFLGIGWSPSSLSHLTRTAEAFRYFKKFAETVLRNKKT